MNQEELWTETPDVDWVVVERLTQGLPVKANQAERHEAAIALLARGLSLTRVASLVGVTSRTVERWARDAK